MANSGRIIKSKTTERFTTLPNDICQSSDMTLEEKGMLAYLLSLPSDWVVYRQSLYNQLPDVKFRIDKAFKSLQDKGYIRSIRVHNESTGKFMGWDHVVYDQSENSPTLTIAEVGDHRSRCLPKSAFTEIGDNAPIQKKHSLTKEILNTNKESAPSFWVPTFEEVTEYFQEKGCLNQAEKYFNYYQSNGWKVGKNKMKDWKASVRNWITRQKEFTNGKNSVINGKVIGRNDYKGYADSYDLPEGSTSGFFAPRSETV